MSRSDAQSGESQGIGAGYAMFQLSRALVAEESTSDPEVRARAAQRIARWQQVIAHAVQGTAHYGSRTPVAEIPAWVTLEVLTGGFATGNFLAGGELTEYERELAASIPGVRAGSARSDLNAWHLTDEGIKSLQGRLACGDYQIDVSEESALPTVAWLLQQQRAEEARSLIEMIVPFFDRIRFFPPPAQGGPVSAVEVHVFDAGEVRQRLATQPERPRIAAQRQAIAVRLPLFDAAVAHFLLTFAEDWPCRQYPEGWREQAAALCVRFDRARSDGAFVGNSAKGRVAELFGLLAQCARDPTALTGRQVGRIRKIVGDFIRKRGRPGSKVHEECRAEQRRQVATPPHHVIARTVSERMARYPSNAGVSDFAPLTLPISAEEAEVFRLAEGVLVPKSIRRRLDRCRSGTISELIDVGLITSGDTLAKVMPALTAEIRSSGFRDPTQRRLYASTYRAFRRRRSLLLVDLQSQVRLSELPWVSIVEGDRQSSVVAAETAQQALVESAAATLTAFPQAIIPNKLLQEFRSLATAAGLNLPLVEEVAADIFMGEFSNRFISAARETARLIAGTLYARYYAIDTAELAALSDKVETGESNSWWNRRPPQRDSLASLCARRANAELGTWSTSTNGTVVEQQQILTTQNLAVLFGLSELASLLRSRLGPLALSCFEWICKRQQIRIDGHHAARVMLKNTAYAWRQMLFYLSMQHPTDQRSTIELVDAHFLTQPQTFQERFLPAMLGLRIAAAGDQLRQDGPTVEGARVFLGWTTKSHWLMPIGP